MILPVDAMNAKTLLKRLLHSGLPVPTVIQSVIRSCYRLGVTVTEFFRWLYGFVIVAPVLRSIAKVGEQLRIERIPYIRGPGRVVIGDRVYLSGKINIGFSSKDAEVPELQIGNDTFIGHGCCFNVTRRVSIGSQVLLAGGVRIQDSDGHPLDAEKRHVGCPVAPQDVASVNIEDGAWIGQQCIILKGVTIGRNSVVGAGSVVTKDIPPDTLVAGVPARVIRGLG